VSDLWREADPGEAFRGFDADAESDAAAYRWTFFRPARPKMIAALAAVSGVDEAALRPWLLESGVRHVVEGLQLDTIVDSLEDAWERLIVHDVVPDGAEWPRSWNAFADNAADLAMLASDWTNVRAAEALAIEAANAVAAWTPGEPDARETVVRWSEVDFWSEPASVIPWTFRKEFPAGSVVWDDEDLLPAPAAPTPEYVLQVRLRAACVEALNGWSRDVLLFDASEETLAAYEFARAADGDGPTAALAKRKPNVTRPLRAIRRLGYSLGECRLDGDVRLCTLLAPTFRWPHG
jgi:hypothetical protein